ncbi:hypothetical protein BC477_08150 [Clavibacter michiganensis subsp. michiganensis]|uniref:Uncharacterized protein n=1 Tax=Clavibacter michiganensis subsp. michiganensis TaxID=33013 RepID=A0A251XNB6_CLAMM|nr:hypothetical protein BC477_08150 [Clavibacter michiganensis subsp. michiganensis]OUE04693.1 hypothetical protein CMMCAS07_07080 [Clavibacter michiganensis subsp. michiganensis]
MGERLPRKAMPRMTTHVPTTPQRIATSAPPRRARWRKSSANGSRIPRVRNDTIADPSRE